MLCRDFAIRELILHSLQSGSTRSWCDVGSLQSYFRPRLDPLSYIFLCSPSFPGGWAQAVSLDRWNDGKCTLLIPLGPKKKKIAAAFSLHTTHKHFFTTEGDLSAAWECGELGGAWEDKCTTTVEEEREGSSEVYEGKVVLQVAPGGAGRRFYYRCRNGVGEGEGETKPEMGSHSYSGAVAVAVRCRSELPGFPLPSFPPTFPLGKWGVITKTLGQASLFATDVYRAVP